MEASRVRPLRFWLAALAGFAAHGMAAAQMADPTRPPGAYVAGQQPRAAEGLADPASTDAQIVVSGPSRRFAIVNGQAVRPGETVNGARLVAINKDGAVWDRDGVTERSDSSPAIRKTIRQAEPKDGKSKAKKSANGEVQ
jgi:hypothetical protein